MYMWEGHIEAIARHLLLLSIALDRTLSLRGKINIVFYIAVKQQVIIAYCISHTFAFILFCRYLCSTLGIRPYRIIFRNLW